MHFDHFTLSKDGTTMLSKTHVLTLLSEAAKESMAKVNVACASHLQRTSFSELSHSYHMTLMASTSKQPYALALPVSFDQENLLGNPGSLQSPRNIDLPGNTSNSTQMAPSPSLCRRRRQTPLPKASTSFLHQRLTPFYVQSLLYDS